MTTMTENGHAAKKAKIEGQNGVFSNHSVCLVLDYGSQYTQLIARRIRENGVLSMLMPGDATMVRKDGLCASPHPSAGLGQCMHQPAGCTSSKHVWCH